MGPDLRKEIEDNIQMEELQLKIRGLFKSLGIRYAKKRKEEVMRILNLTEEEYHHALYYKNWLTKLGDKLKSFKEAKDRRPSVDFTIYDLFEKFGEKPKCYMTGRELEWDWVSFDHLIPSCKGGSNDLDNLGITTHFFNILKSDWPVEYLFEKMKEALEYQGYTVIPPKGREKQSLQSVMEKHFEEKKILSEE